MANTTDFLPVATGTGANVDTQANFAGSSYQTLGFQTGIARSAQTNKIWRQASMMAAAWATVIINQLAQNVPDDGNLTNLVTQLTQAMGQVAANLVKPQIITVPYSATPTFNCALGNTSRPVFSITLSGNVTSSSFSNLVPGQQITIHIIENATGGYGFVWPSGTVGAGAIDTTANQINTQVFTVNLASVVSALAPLALTL
jgi:hypothetical protein